MTLKNRFEFCCCFSFSPKLEKQIWTSYFVFRFRITLNNGYEFPFPFSHYFDKRIGISFLVFASLWKMDWNFVSRFRITLKNGFEFRFSFLYGLLLKNWSEFLLSFLHDLKNGSLHQSSHLKSPDTPPWLTGAFTFYASESKWIFLSPGQSEWCACPPWCDDSHEKNTQLSQHLHTLDGEGKWRILEDFTTWSHKMRDNKKLQIKFYSLLEFL